MNTKARDRVNDLLSEFGASRGLIGARLNDSGVCAFEYQELLDMVLELSSDGATLHFYSPLCELPSQEREAFLTELLERNLLCAQTNGATLAVDARENQVVLCFNQPVEALDPATFSTVMENFLDTALNVRSDLDAVRAPSQGAASHAEHEGLLAFGMRI
ncbi:CesT family type III secretion system chaperone [Verrucomicrobium sp. BvORR034]|uniref:CesT family type III secretion system chaperone n=1 Tax=Verrucomicrobium sp. BvORR034 TaxID=1396418 RepID=UPI000679D218|nr:CesT family type III secretion system chaperone [Verrucomicrobium sp. BvORR034]